LQEILLAICSPCEKYQVIKHKYFDGSKEVKDNIAKKKEFENNHVLSRSVQESHSHLRCRVVPTVLRFGICNPPKLEGQDKLIQATKTTIIASHNLSPTPKRSLE
jgi:hypothetical protein